MEQDKSVASLECRYRLLVSIGARGVTDWHRVTSRDMSPCEVVLLGKVMRIFLAVCTSAQNNGTQERRDGDRRADPAEDRSSRFVMRRWLGLILRTN